MNPVSIIILLLIIAYCAFVIYKQVQKERNKGGCGGKLCRLLRMQQFSGEGSSVKKKEGNQQWEIQQVLCFMHLQSLLDYILSG